MGLVDIVLSSKTLLNSFYFTSKHALCLFSSIALIQELFLNVPHLLLEKRMKTTDALFLFQELSSHESIHILISGLELLLIVVLLLEGYPFSHV